MLIYLLSFVSFKKSSKNNFTKIYIRYYTKQLFNLIYKKVKLLESLCHLQNLINAILLKLVNATLPNLLIVLLQKLIKTILATYVNGIYQILQPGINQIL